MSFHQFLNSMLNIPSTRSTVTLLLVGSSFLPMASVAQTVVEPEAKGQWGLGVGAGIRRSPYRGADDNSAVLPILTYDSDRFKFAGTTLDWKLGTAGDLSFSARARYDLRSGYEAKDSDDLSGMDERKAGVWLGGHAAWSTSFARISSELMKATGNSKGTQAKLGIDRDFRTGNFIVTPRADVIWQDKKYVNYYYGVKADEVTANRAAYDGKSTVSFELGLRTVYVIDRKQSVFLDLSVTTLGSKIKNSPIVDQKTLPGAAVGYVYRF